MKRVYIAHAFSGTLEEQAENRRKAIKWVVWAATTQNVAPEAMWIILTGELPETPENRALGLEIDKELVAGCDEVWLVGTRVSGGMQVEADHARSLGIPVVDMTDPARPLPPGCDNESTADTLRPEAPGHRCGFVDSHGYECLLRAGHETHHYGAKFREPMATLDERAPTPQLETWKGQR